MENSENDETTQKPLDNLDVLILFILTTSSFIIRYWRISLPPTTVFDEVYFGNFTNYYIQSQFFYDIHPPLAKIIMYFIANISEYNGSMSFKFNAKGYPLPDYVQLRLTPATFSALVFPLIYFTMRFSGFSHISSLCSSLLAFFDTSLATEGRHILTDGILHFFTILHVAVLTYTMSIKSKYRTTTKFFIWHFLTGITLGCACSCKNTAWGLTVLDAFCYIIQFTDMLSIKKFRDQKNSQKVQNKNLEDNSATKNQLFEPVPANNDEKEGPNTDSKEENDKKIITSPDIQKVQPSEDHTDNQAVTIADKTDQEEEDREAKKQTFFISTFSGDTDQTVNLLSGESSAALLERIIHDQQEGSTENSVHLSNSPLEIQASIQSSVVNVTSTFDKEYDDAEFVSQEGTGSGLFWYIFSVAAFGITLAIIALSVYIISFDVHFILLPFAGKGTGFLRPDMKAQLIQNQCATCRAPNVTKPEEGQIAKKANYDESYDECINSAIYGIRLKKPSLFMRTFILTFRMHTGNMRIVGFHSSQSFPKHWPVLGSVSPYFWGMSGREIRCHGNAIVYFLVLFSLFAVVLYAVFRAFFLAFVFFFHKRKKCNCEVKKFFLNYFSIVVVNYRILVDSCLDELNLNCSSFEPFCNKKWIIALRYIVGYCVSYFPFFWIPRTLYLYHYLIPLMFGCLSFGSMVELLLPVRYRGVLVVLVCIAAAFGFWLWAPYVYGTDKHDQQMMIWTRRWIDGDEEHIKAKIENNRKKNGK